LPGLFRARKAQTGATRVNLARSREACAGGRMLEAALTWQVRFLFAATIVDTCMILAAISPRFRLNSDTPPRHCNRRCCENGDSSRRIILHAISALFAHAILARDVHVNKVGRAARFGHTLVFPSVSSALTKLRCFRQILAHPIATPAAVAKIAHSRVPPSARTRRRGWLEPSRLNSSFLQRRE
jgi:hypothetical protein